MGLKTLLKVFRESRCIALWFAVSLIVFAIAVWWPNLALIVQVFKEPDVPVVFKLSLPLSLLTSISTNFTPLTAAYVILIALLFGVNVAMTVYYLRRRISEIKSGGLTLGFFGLIASLFSLGCAACGPLLITSLLSLFGASGVLAFLPFKGGELGILGAVMLLISIYLIGKQIDNPTSCRLR